VTGHSHAYISAFGGFDGVSGSTDGGGSGSIRDAAGNRLPDAVATIVPEPATFGMMGAALLLWIAVRKKVAHAKSAARA
jgi:hypothetical protein